MLNQNKLPALLIVLDGWGISTPTRANAIAQAKKPFFESLVKNFPTYVLQASGEVVGLTWGEMGNSEVGHLTIGSGRIIYQSLARINKSITDKTFLQNPTLYEAAQHVKKNNSALHLIGMVSNGGVHSHRDHLYALLDYCQAQNIQKVFLHVILDGRDTDRNAGAQFIEALKARIADTPNVKIATLSGRFFAMDRDNHWDRTQKAYEAMVMGTAKKTHTDPVEAIMESYANEIYDEEFEPVVIAEDKKPIATIEENDAVIFFNFRSDRARQLTSAFIIPGFEKFTLQKQLKNLFFASFTQYDKDFPCAVVFPPVTTKNTLAEVISKNGLSQLHAAETEKYAHVTFFFNGGVEEVVPNESRMLVPSPMVTSYDQKPEMSAYELTNKVLKEISKNSYQFIVMNYANADMVGHTGNFEATVKAVQTLDECLQKIVTAILEKHGTVFITADHGNAEDKINMETGEIIKEHSKNPVPFIIVNEELRGQTVFDINSGTVDEVLSSAMPSGMLADIAPTILKLLNIEIPPDMTGSAL